MSQFVLENMYEKPRYMGGTEMDTLRWGVEQQQKQAEAEAKQAELSRYRDMTPLELERVRLGNMGLEADLPGRHAESLKKGYEATKTGATLATDINKTNITNETEVLGQKVKATEHISQALGQAAGILSQLPPAVRHAKFLDMVSSQGLDPNDPKLGPMIQQLSRVDGERLPTALDGFRTHVIKQGQSYRQALDIAEMQKQSHLAGIKYQQDAMDARLDKEIEAGKFKKGNTVSFTMKFMSMPIDRQNAEIAQAMATGISPITGEKMTEDEQVGLTARFHQNKATMDAQLAAKVQPGVAAQTSGAGDISLMNKQPPTTPTLPGKQPALSVEDMRKALR